MVFILRYFFVFIFLMLSTQLKSTEMTLQELFFDKSKPYHLKILDALPKDAILQVGPDNAENTIIEFMDYFCGYCKKIHPELMQLAEERDDVKVVFLHHPILSESSNILAKMSVAASMQGKGMQFHNELFSMQGSITQKKLDEVLDKVEINKTKLMIDIGKDEINGAIELSSFLAKGSGARGTPAIFINEEFVGGYIPPGKLQGLLR